MQQKIAKQLVFICLGSLYDVGSLFLFIEIRGFLERIRFYLDAVLDKRQEVGEAMGNANSIDVYPEKTKVVYLFPKI